MFKILKNGDEFVDFSNVADAIRFKLDRGLYKSWPIVADHPDLGPKGYESALMLAAMLVNDELRPMLRSANFKKLMRRDIKFLPADEFTGRQNFTAVYASVALAKAGHEGWVPVRGQYLTADGPVDHAWLQSESGAIMDIAASGIYRLPVMAIDASDEECIARYVAQDELLISEEQLARFTFDTEFLELLREVPMFIGHAEPALSPA